MLVLSVVIGVAYIPDDCPPCSALHTQRQAQDKQQYKQHTAKLPVVNTVKELDAQYHANSRRQRIETGEPEDLRC